jgi:glycine betaine/proline transport system permease protein
VLSTMRKAEFGPSLLAGLVIALLAILMDRIGRGFAARASVTRIRPTGPFHRRHPYLSAAGAALLIGLAVAAMVPPLWHFPDEWTLNLGETLNHWVELLVIAWGDTADRLKNFVLFTYLLPLRIGLEHSVRASYWGFDMSPTVAAIYVVLTVAVAGLAARFWNWRGAAGVVVLATIYYFGTTGLPWAVVIAAVTLAAYGAGGRNLALFALLSMLFILLSGVWTPAMWSVYLMMGGVGISFVVGGLLGIWASTNDRVSAVLSTVNDVLQTMPQFVYLIPIIMLFKIGDFSALLAIISYAIVPAIRYTELGLRGVPSSTIEAARMMGSTPRQILLQVKLPLALPQILLGLNQTIMLGFTMLVIAALVGTRDLGQVLYGSLAKANFGLGMIAGGSVALLAILCDRILQAVSARSAKRLGLGLKTAG